MFITPNHTKPHLCILSFLHLFLYSFVFVLICCCLSSTSWALSAWPLTFSGGRLAQYTRDSDQHCGMLKEGTTELDLYEFKYLVQKKGEKSHVWIPVYIHPPIIKTHKEKLELNFFFLTTSFSFLLGRQVVKVGIVRNKLLSFFVYSLISSREKSVELQLNCSLCSTRLMH